MDEPPKDDPVCDVCKLRWSEHHVRHPFTCQGCKRWYNPALHAGCPDCQTPLKRRDALT